jgi:hypothetical protein
MISGFRRQVDEHSALLCDFAASSGNLTDVSGQPMVPIFGGQESLNNAGFLNTEDRTDKVDYKLQLRAA